MDMQIIFRPRFPYDVNPADFRGLRNAEATVAEWRRLFASSASKEVDFEDWHESACQLLAAIDTGLPVFAVQHRDKECNRPVVRTFNTSLTHPVKGVSTIVVGTQLKYDPLENPESSYPVIWPKFQEAYRVNGYYLAPPFYRYAARAAVPAYIPEDLTGALDRCSAISVIRDMAENGHRNLFIKVAHKPKYMPPFRITVADPGDTKAIADQLMAELDYGLIHLAGIPNSLLIQEDIWLAKEYRVVVVGGKVVSGAGCIEKFCPPYNEGFVFHTVVETTRGNGVYANDPETVRRYLARAEKAVAEFSAYDPSFLNCTLDFGLRDDGRIALIEANPLLNFGLYAMNYRAILGAIIAECRKTLERDRQTEHAPAIIPA